VRKRLTNAMAEFVLAIAGIDPNDPTPAKPSGKPADPEQVFAQLFSIATGWLGWTPEEAWNATPAEIIAAKGGRTEMIVEILKAEEHTSELQSRENLVCRLLLEKKNKKTCKIVLSAFLHAW